MYCRFMIQGNASIPKQSHVPLKSYTPTQSLKKVHYDLLKGPLGRIPHLQTPSLCFSL